MPKVEGRYWRLLEELDNLIDPPKNLFQLMWRTLNSRRTGIDFIKLTQLSLSAAEASSLQPNLIWN
jgi:hypothetical protein